LSTWSACFRFRHFRRLILAAFAAVPPDDSADFLPDYIAAAATPPLCRYATPSPRCCDACRLMRHASVMTPRCRCRCLRHAEPPCHAAAIAAADYAMRLCRHFRAGATH